MKKKVQGNKTYLLYQSMVLILFTFIFNPFNVTYCKEKVLTKHPNGITIKKPLSANQKNTTAAVIKRNNAPIQAPELGDIIVEKHVSPVCIEQKEHIVTYSVGKYRAVSLMITNGKLKKISLYRIGKNQELIALSDNIESINKKSYNLENGLSLYSKDLENNFLESSWDDEHFSNNPWIMINAQNTKGEIISTEKFSVLYKNTGKKGEEYTLTFEKKNHDGSKMHRQFIIGQSKLIIKESLVHPGNNAKVTDHTTHSFSVKVPLTIFQNKRNYLTIFNETSDGGLYNLKGNIHKPFLGIEQQHGFLLDIERQNGEKKKNIPLEKINLLVKNYNKEGYLATNIMYDKKLLLINTNNQENHRLVLLRKKKESLEIQYVTENLPEINNVHILEILYDFQGLDVINEQSKMFPIIKKLMPIGIWGKIKLLIVTFVQWLMELTRKVSPILGFILFICLVKIIALAILHFLYKRTGVERKHLFSSLISKSKDNGNIFLSLLPGLIDIFSIGLVTSVSSNSSLFVMEKFLWIKDFSGYDNIALGFSKIHLTPLAVMAAASIMLSGMVESEDNNTGSKQIAIVGKIMQVIFIFLMSLLFNLFYCPTNLYWILSGIFSILYYLFFRRKRRVSYRKV